MLFCVLLNANDNMPTTVALLNLLYPVCCYCNEIAWHFFFWIVRFPSTYVCMYSMPCVSYNFRHSFFYTIRRILHIRCHLGFCWFGDISIPFFLTSCGHSHCFCQRISYKYFPDGVAFDIISTDCCSFLAIIDFL